MWLKRASEWVAHKHVSHTNVSQMCEEEKIEFMMNSTLIFVVTKKRIVHVCFRLVDILEKVEIVFYGTIFLTNFENHRKSQQACVEVHHLDGTNEKKARNTRPSIRRLVASFYQCKLWIRWAFVNNYHTSYNLI